MLVGPRGPPPGALPDGPGTSGAGMAAAPQGFLVVTPLVLAAATAGTNNKQDNRSKKKKNDVDDDDTSTVLLVNRGWVPMQRVLQQHGRQPRHLPPHQQKRQQQSNNHGGGNSEPSALLQWDRPTGDVQVTVVPGKPEGSYCAVMDCLDYSFK